MVIDFQKWLDGKRLDALGRALAIFQRKALLGMNTPADVDRVIEARRAYVDWPDERVAKTE